MPPLFKWERDASFRALGWESLSAGVALWGITVAYGVMWLGAVGWWEWRKANAEDGALSVER
ncbi:hypothetical protein [Luteolibacter soli]|uniref:Uncharacterized protein n=1 Tax=Luteolibacter soli TaxID=3135280 RepID=A0ABU9AVA0_9BACT